MPVTESEAQRGRGRPRDAEKDAAIREAAWRLLADRGYDGLTFEGVAEIAGCSRATLYRRFASKVELVAAILDETARSVEPDLAPSTSPRDALIAHASAGAIYMSGHRGHALVGLGVSAARVPDLVDALTRHSDNELGFYRREFLRLNPSAGTDDVEFAVQTLVGAMVYHVAMLQRPLANARIEQLVDRAIAFVSV